MSIRTVGPYDVGRVIGRGLVGDVREAIHRPTKKKMAMKVIDRTAMVDPTLGERLRREIAIMKLLDHPHVVSVSVAFKFEIFAPTNRKQKNVDVRMAHG